MDAQLVNRLLALNREFYAQFAQAFSETRSPQRANIAPIMPYLRAGDKTLDVGCGNGRMLAALDRAGLRLDYVGVDVTPALIDVAHARAPRLQHITAAFRVADITTPDAVASLRADAPFDVALMLAVLHHIPSFALRCAVVREVGSLLRPDGILVMCNWQFTRTERLRKKIVPWQAIGVDEREVEAGDALLDWQRGGIGYRYCHLLTETEAQAIAEASGFVVRDQFHADHELNLYSVLRRTE